eukprot:scaffold8988_cov112-Isochrysis_galbana.AAC.5
MVQARAVAKAAHGTSYRRLRADLAGEMSSAGSARGGRGPGSGVRADNWLGGNNASLAAHLAHRSGSGDAWGRTCAHGHPALGVPGT